MSANELSTDRLVTDLKRVVRDSEELLQATAGAVGDKARERLTDALASAKRTCHRLEEKAIVGAKVADRVVREHPYQSIGVAVGVGMLLGVLVIRK